MALQAGAANRAWLMVLIIGLICLAGVYVQKQDYYQLSSELKAVSEFHAAYRSSGRVGLAFGLVATALFTLNLAYLLRRRMVRARFVGSLRSWMNMHVVSGILGATCVAFHAGFLVRSAIGALAVGTLAIVVIAGVVGRYLYAQVPRSVEGLEMQYEQLRHGFEASQQGVMELGLKVATPPVPQRGHDKSKALVLLRILAGNKEARQEFHAALHTLQQRQLPKDTLKDFKPKLRQLFRQRQAMLRFYEITELMASWRFLHRWLALVMIAAVVCHIVLAMRYGRLELGEVFP